MVKVATSLPSLLLPCPRCTIKMECVASEPSKLSPGLEDDTYACAQCGTEVIRTRWQQSAA